MQVGGGHLQKFHPVIPVVAKSRVIHLQNLQRLALEDPHGQRIVREQEERIGFALPERLHHEVAGVAKGSLLQSARHHEGEAGQVLLQNIIRDALLDALDGYFLTEDSGNQDKWNIVFGLAHRGKGVHAGPARQPVIREHNVERKTPEVLQEFRSCGDNLRFALKSRVFQLMEDQLGVRH